ncbi:HAD hydrolase-like protein [Acetobacter sp.]|jgi:phosphoglycolate phosphatase|uniref:HAD hydrolase-like protein n=1 Tax=Acetobacter sp. TaxID=440 RepID=UPI0025C3832A|nr:HAD hydrolase-like protein [Acetobacter sp.]MCH4090330.1 HAD hydrolase-like protein [Acetobacter sp.]MCI1299024.1 HAD hydrolase-like protein [Acetobacter sp.]MCI1315044.1 HAD hydrolase-like protein [Acetobacter sp.]
MTAHPLAGSSVLFDLDGTIIDSRAGIIGTIRKVLRELGHEPDLDQDLTWVVGPPLRDLIGEVLRHYGDDRCDEAMEAYRRHYEAEGMFRTPVFPGMREAIASIRETGATLYIATSKPRMLARAILERADLLSEFREVYGARPDDSGAEKPELIASVLSDHQIEKHHAIMLGDRRFDISGAHANGIRAIGIAWGYGGDGELIEAGADAIATTPSDLPRLVSAQVQAALKHVHA